MKLFLGICLVILLQVAIVAGRALDQATIFSTSRSQTALIASPYEPLLYHLPYAQPQAKWLSLRALDSDAVYTKAQCSGQKLFQAMKTDADTADRFIYPLKTIFDGSVIRKT
jgi:hypothetical protein